MQNLRNEQILCRYESNLFPKRLLWLFACVAPSGLLCQMGVRAILEIPGVSLERPWQKLSIWNKSPTKNKYN